MNCYKRIVGEVRRGSVGLCGGFGQFKEVLVSFVQHFKWFSVVLGKRVLGGLLERRHGGFIRRGWERGGGGEKRGQKGFR